MSKVYVLFLILFSLLSGCASIHQTFAEQTQLDKPNGYENKVYAGIRKDSRNIIICFSPFALITCPIALFSIIDLPFSFVADTLFLPYTIPKTAANKKLKEQRTQDNEKKMALVRDYVRDNKDVIREAGEIKYLSVKLLSHKGKSYPDRYDVTIERKSGNNIYAIVHDSSSSDDAKFSLECITHFMSNYRDLNKDVCAQ